MLEALNAIECIKDRAYRNLVAQRLHECILTRFGPNRPAADMEGNGEFHFWVIFRIFGDILDDFWRIFEEFWRN